MLQAFEQLLKPLEPGAVGTKSPSVETLRKRVARLIMVQLCEVQEATCHAFRMLGRSLSWALLGLQKRMKMHEHPRKNIEHIEQRSKNGFILFLDFSCFPRFFIGFSSFFDPFPSLA